MFLYSNESGSASQDDSVLMLLSYQMVPVLGRLLKSVQSEESGLLGKEG